MKFLLLFLTLPVVETLLIVVVKHFIGFWSTLALIVVTAVVGWYFARAQGVQTLNRIRGDISDGTLPAESLLDGGLIVIAGILLMVPGLLTDVVGFSLLIPFTRTMLRKRIAQRFLNSFQFSSISTMEIDVPGNGEVVDGKVVDKPEKKPQAETVPQYDEIDK